MENPNPRKDIIIKCNLGEMVKLFFKDYMVIWHDPNLNTEENQLHINQLEQFCKIETFTKWEEAAVSIRKTKRICHVITSGTNGDIFTREIESNENVSSIYVFCKNKDYHSNWTKSSQKISCIETEMQSIFNKIEENLLEWYKQSSSLKLSLPTFAPIFNDTHKSHMNRLHRYLKFIPNFQNREQAKNDFTSLSRIIYSEKKNLKDIIEFESSYNVYERRSILKWYTRESFLYKVTNNCLRIATADSIQYCRLLLKDIQEAIKEQYQMKSKNFSGLLYRGAYLSDEEWSSLKGNVGREIEMHGFLSVSKEKNVALGFLKMDPTKKVFISIIVPKGPNDEEQGFAEIDEFSRFPHEKEVLFNVRSRFTVLEIEEKYSEELPSRHLVLLYGAQGFRKFLAKQNPVQEVSIPENILCTHCKAASFEIHEKTFFVPIGNLENSRISQLSFSEKIFKTIQGFFNGVSKIFSLGKSKSQIMNDLKNNNFYCKDCLPKFIKQNAAPLLCVTFTNDFAFQGANTSKTEIKGAVLTKKHTQIPFYGYQCAKCQTKRHQIYFTCNNCEKKRKRWCGNCFEETSSCMKLGHSIILESSPFSFWYEQMSEEEFNHLKVQNDLVSNNIFQQADMYVECHEYEKAIQYYETYIDQNVQEGRDINLADCFNNLGTVYSSCGDYKNGLEYCFKSLDIRKSDCAEEQHTIAISYNNIAKIYVKQREYEKAQTYFLKSLDITKSIYGENHKNVAKIFHNIGTMHLQQREFDKALEYGFKAESLMKSLGGDQHTDISVSYDHIGLIFYAQQKDQEALKYFMKSLQIRKSVYGEEHQSVATSYTFIGKIFESQRENQKALEYHFRSLKIRESIYGLKHHEVAISHLNISKCYLKKREYTSALEYCVKSQDSMQAISEDKHPDAADTYDQIGFIYLEQKRYDKALESLLKSLEIRQAIYGVKHPDVADSYLQIGGIYAFQQELQKASECFFKSLEIMDLAPEKDHPNRSNLLEAISILEMKNQEKQENS